MTIRLATMLGFCLAVPAAAQTIEVASIKPALDRAADPNLNSLPGGRLLATNITVRYLVRLAYDVQDYQIERAPRWMDSDGFDIAAKGEGAVKRSLEEERAFVRELLTTRFALQAHRESRQANIYRLVVGKTGPKLTPHEGPGARTRSGCGHLAGTGLTMDVVALVLSRQLERSVLNQTALPGKYDFQIDWSPDLPCRSAAAAEVTASDPSGRPSLENALQQLGLKLEPAKGPQEFLVIDRLERPAEN